MNYAPQIVEAFKASAIKRVLIVDDAYDPPTFEDEGAGALVAVLTGGELRQHVGDDVLSAGECDAAVDALNDSEWDDEAIAHAMARLYRVFVDTRTGAVDPGDRFADTKGAALEALDPVWELLRRCGDADDIQTVGTGEAAIAACRELRPELIVMDFFVSPPERSARGVTKGQTDGDRGRSIALLRRLLSENGTAPAVVLMSSEEVAERTEAYRGRLEGRVMALRFGYLHKGWVQGVGQALSASGDAADVLGDTAASFAFGRTLETALGTWKSGAEKALQQLYRELRDLDVKDFAYLLRLRLYDEGEAFRDYLEWLLGESLRAIVDDEVEWTRQHFRRLDEKQLTEMIEGAHPLPSGRVAEFYHRMRFNSRVGRPRKRVGMGDVFVAPSRKGVRMVISQDCDLVARNGKAAADRILSVGGKIRTLEEDRVFAGELFVDKTPKAIQWNLKDVMSHEFGDAATLSVGGTAYEFVASMRPMFAQTVQKAVLADLSRVGGAVPPSVHVGAPVKVYLKTKVGNQAEVVEVLGLAEARAQVVLPRGGKDIHKRALFTQRFVRELLAKLEEVNEGDLLGDHRPHRREFIEEAPKVRVAMLREGLKLPGEGVFKLVTSVGKPRNKGWLELVVDVSDEALLELQGTDPLEQR
ncbi:MAG: hypothetical protein OXU81_06880 [Gammaproteobacteria bacterium]|nr:hypothetical protein [Gammaproteobacteria bacterium]